MNKLMKAALVAALVSVSALASAQVSVNVGYVNTSTTVKYSSLSSSESMPGITAGLGYDMNIQGELGIAWGLNYSYIWKTEKNDLLLGSEKNAYRDHVLDIPVRVTYGFPISDNFKLTAFAGPKFAYAVSGTSTTTYEGTLIDGSSSVNHYGKDAQRSAFDIKLGAGVGANISNVLVKVGYDFGLLNQYTGSDSNSSLRSNQFYVTLGYQF